MLRETEAVMIDAFNKFVSIYGEFKETKEIYEAQQKLLIEFLDACPFPKDWVNDFKTVIGV